jgi:hypothetical protein
MSNYCPLNSTQRTGLAALRCAPVSCVPENLAKFVLSHLPETNPETNELGAQYAVQFAAKS